MYEIGPLWAPHVPPPPHGRSEGEALTPTQLTIKPVKPTDGGGRGTKLENEEAGMSTTGNEYALDVLGQALGNTYLVAEYSRTIQDDQKHLPDVPISPEDKEGPSIDYQKEEEDEYTTPSVEQSTGESQESEPKSESHCSFDKKGKCRLHAQQGRKIVSKRKVWTKKKYGFGWVTKQVVMYQCNQDVVSRAPD